MSQRKFSGRHGETRPDGKMGSKYVHPYEHLPWYDSRTRELFERVTSGRNQVVKHRANKKRRQRDRKSVED